MTVEEGSVLIRVATPSGGVSQKVFATDQITVGREDVDLTIPKATISRRHAEFYRDPFGRWWVRDLGSRNGTLVNNRKITEYLLRPNERVSIGGYELTLLPLGKVHRMDSREAKMGKDTMDDVRGLDEFGTPSISADHLRTVMGFAMELQCTDTTEERYQLLCKMLVGRQFESIQAMILSIDSSVGGKQTRVQCLYMAGEKEQRPLSRSVLKMMLQKNQFVVGSNMPEAGADTKLSFAFDDDDQAAAVIACPLTSMTGEHLALYALLPGYRSTPNWLALIDLVAVQFSHAETAWSARRYAVRNAQVERDLEQASQLQCSLVPREVTLRSLQTAMVFKPCRWVGGDYFDVLSAPDGRVLLFMADVCGKGLQASLVTASLHAIIHNEVNNGHTLDAIFSSLDQYLCDSLPEGRFVTLAGIAIEPATGALRYINAGHLAPLVVGADGQCRELDDGENMPLGICRSQPVAKMDQLAPDQVLVLYTDGVTEMPDIHGRLLGSDGLKRIIQQAGRAAGSNLQDWMGRIEQALDQRMTHIQADDIALLAVRRVESR